MFRSISVRKKGPHGERGGDVTLRLIDAQLAPNQDHVDYSVFAKVYEATDHSHPVKSSIKKKTRKLIFSFFLPPPNVAVGRLYVPFVPT
jgi:hypothetical protein